MRLHRFIGNFSALGGSAFGGDLTLKHFDISDAEFLHQVKDVLRLKAGDEMILSDGRLNEALAKIIRSDKKSIEVEILNISKNENEPAICGVLYCSILKRENFEWVCQKATEAGVREIVPIISMRTVKLGFKEDRLKKIVKEAGEQSGRGQVPVISAPVKFEEALNSAESQNDLSIFFEMGYSALDPAEFKAMNLKRARLAEDSAKRVGIFIGPEGGWSPEELELIKEKAQKDKNFKIAGLGKLTLRAETAAVVASWFICQLNT